jgi:hypothetical protein
MKIKERRRITGRVSITCHGHLLSKPFSLCTNHVFLCPLLLDASPSGASTYYLWCSFQNRELAQNPGLPICLWLERPGVYGDVKVKWFLFVFDNRGWTQFLTFVKQVFNCLSNAPSPFAFNLFLKYGLVLLPMPHSNCDPPTSTSQLAGITTVHHYTVTGLTG